MVATATLNDSAAKLASMTGLNAAFVRVWLKVENGFALNNPLGLRDYRPGAPAGHPLIHFPTLDAGLAATADLINTAPQYAGIRSTVNGSIRQQALAVIKSPWNVPNSPYYLKHFTAAGLLGAAPGGGAGLTTPHGPTSHPVVSAPAMAGAASAASGGSSGGGTFSAGSSGVHTLFDYLSQAGVAVNPTDTYAQVRQKALTAFTNDKQFQPWMRSGPVLSVTLARYLSTPINQIPWTRGAFSGTWNPTQPSGTNDPGYTGASGAIGSFFDWGKWLPGFAVNVAILAAVLVLGYRGLREVLG